MKKIFVMILALAMLCGCASPSKSSSLYKPATNSGFGYKDTLLAQNQYRIQFKAAGINAKKARDYALLRAAELTREQGYDWFEVNKRDIYTDERENKIASADLASRQLVARNCGLLGCRTDVQTIPDDNTFNQDNPMSEYTVVLEIGFGKGIRPAKKDVYDAVEIIEKFHTAN